MSLDVPMTFVGLTALSEEVKRTRSRPLLSAALMTDETPMMLVLTALKGLRSQEGTCFRAAV